MRRYAPHGMSQVTVRPPLGMPEAPSRPHPGGYPAAPPPPAPRARKPPKRKRKHGIFWRYRRVWFLFAFVAFTALAGAVWVITQIPLPSEAPLAQTTLIYDGAGQQVAELHGVENRFPVKIEQVPQVAQDAVIAAEDRHFLDHNGVDPWSIVRATWADVRNKGVTQGGSTITQQYVKNQIVGSERSLARKLKEAVVAVKLERKYSKQEILEKYLNTVYFGRGAYGIQAASLTYFKKNVSDLDLKESAYLAGLIRTPSTGDVFSDPESAYYLRTSVLHNMVRDGTITQADADAVEKTKIENYVWAPERADTTFSERRSPGSEYFIDYVRQQLIQNYGEDRVLRGGLRVYTTLDPKAQEMAYNSVYETLNDPENDPIGALVSLDGDGRVVAMVGNRDWNASQVNVAAGKDGGGGGRQGGSAFKPFVLAEALKQGVSIDNKWYNGAAKIGPLPGWEDEVHNYGDAPYGFLNLVEATVNSVNTVYAQLVNDVGPTNVVATAKDMGITSDLKAVPSIALGTQEVSVLEMADAYLTIFREGTHVDPRVISKITEGGTVLVDDRPTGQRRALSREIAKQLRDVLGAVVERGTGINAQVQGGAWGKTGTTEGYGDAWFVGGNDKLVTAVWMGYPEGQSRPLRWVHNVPSVSGGTLPALIFSRFMNKAAPGEGKPAPNPVIDLRSLSSGPATGSNSRTATTLSSESADTASSATTTSVPPTTTTVPEAVAPPVSVTSVPATTTPQPPSSLAAPTATFPTPTTARTSPTITRPDLSNFRQ